MTFGIGTDILDISRLDSQPLSYDDSFIRKVYTENEWDEAQSRRIVKNYLATRFAGKEAVFKAIDLDGNDTRVRLNDIEILNAENGKPYVTLYGYIKERADEAGIKTVHISLSYDGKYAAAFALAEK